MLRAFYSEGFFETNESHGDLPRGSTILKQRTEICVKSIVRVDTPNDKNDLESPTIWSRCGFKDVFSELGSKTFLSARKLPAVRGNKQVTSPYFKVLFCQWSNNKPGFTLSMAKQWACYYKVNVILTFSTLFYFILFYYFRRHICRQGEINVSINMLALSHVCRPTSTDLVGRLWNSRNSSITFLRQQLTLLVFLAFILQLFKQVYEAVQIGSHFYAFRLTPWMSPIPTKTVPTHYCFHSPGPWSDVRIQTR